MLVSMETHLLVWSTLNFCCLNLKAVDLYSKVPLSRSLFLFLYLLFFPHDFCFISVYCRPTRPLSSSCRFLEISLIKWFRFTFLYRKLICGMEMSLLSRSSSFSSEGLYSISTDLSSSKSGLPVFPQLHKESTT